MGDIRLRWGWEGRLEPEVANGWDGVGEVRERLLPGRIYLPLHTTLLGLQMNKRSLENREEKGELD